ncbi:AAA family ATPase [Paenibacillus albus]|uniref:AAA family ATPase n=1 Tax=Paenibacillus albus TaxID=2495582 RepID=UPI0013DED37C|nr:AAA family ATPase [Paenibacillus albus]
MGEIILLRGRPGVGKTTISNLLMVELNIPVIRKDDFYDVIAEYYENHELRNKVSYGILFRMLQTNAGSNKRFILDFPFNQEEEMRNFEQWVLNQNYILKSIRCICSDKKIWANRFNIRKLNPLPNQLITDFDELCHYYKDLSMKPMDGELVIDTVDSLDANVHRILAYLK